MTTTAILLGPAPARAHLHFHAPFACPGSPSAWGRPRKGVGRRGRRVRLLADGGARWPWKFRGVIALRGLLRPTGLGSRLPLFPLLELVRCTLPTLSLLIFSSRLQLLAAEAREGQGREGCCLLIGKAAAGRGCARTEGRVCPLCMLPCRTHCQNVHNASGGRGCWNSRGNGGAARETVS